MTDLQGLSLKELDNNVWSPRDYPQGWKIVEETP